MRYLSMMPEEEQMYLMGKTGMSFKSSRLGKLRAIESKAQARKEEEEQAQSGDE